MSEGGSQSVRAWAHAGLIGPCCPHRTICGGLSEGVGVPVSPGPGPRRTGWTLCQVSSLKCQVSSAKSQVPNVKCQLCLSSAKVSRAQVSSAKPQVSSVKFQVPSAKSQVPRAKCQASSVPSLKCQVASGKSHAAPKKEIFERVGESDRWDYPLSPSPLRPE